MRGLAQWIAWGAIALSSCTFAQNMKEDLSPVRFEHLRINVADKERTAQWYVDHVGLEMIPSNTEDVVYVADKDRNFMLELSALPNLKNTYADVNIDAFHLAFEGQQSIKEVSERMLKNGGKQDGELYTNKIGDYVLNVRDPNGFALQLLYRVNPFFSKPVKSNIRFEHFAFNTPDQKTAALWYVEFLDLRVPWSKDIDKTNRDFRNYRVPYVGDAKGHMSLELFGKENVEMRLSNQPHDVIHIAFSTEQPEQLAKRLIHGGAVQSGQVRKENGGDVVIDLYDPRGATTRGQPPSESGRCLERVAARQQGGWPRPLAARTIVASNNLGGPLPEGFAFDPPRKGG